MSIQDPMDWGRYFASTKDKPLHPLYDDLDPLLPAQGVALELGCGVGHGALHLAARGLRVVAVDLRSEPLEILRERIPPGTSIEVIQADITAFNLPTCEVAVVGFTLFFMSPTQIAEFWPRLVAAISPGGLFMGQFLGARDEWGSWGYTSHSELEIRAMLDGFEILHFEEVERDGATSWGEKKHWHIFHVIARKLAE